MSYRIVTHLFSERPEIQEMLSNGLLKRWGGSLRWAAGQPNGGQFYEHLKEGWGQEALDWAAGAAAPISSAVRAGSSLYGNFQLQGIQQGVSQLLGLAQAVAACSVVNLGVSLVGFAATYYKLSRLEANVTKLHAAVREFRDEVRGDLAELKTDMAEVLGLLRGSREQMKHIASELDSIRRDLLDSHAARLRAAQESARQGLGSTETHVQTIREVRCHTGLLLERLSPSSKDVATLLMWGTALRLNAMAVFCEAALLRRLGRDGDAIGLLEDVGVQCRERGKTWATEAFRIGGYTSTPAWLAHDGFKSMVSPQREDRILRLWQGKELSRAQHLRLVSDGRTAAAASGFPKDPDAISQASAMADAIDLAAELADRVESQAAVYRWCGERKLGWKEWEAAPLREDVPEGHLLLVAA